MADLHGFDAHQVEPAAGFEPLPAGRYTAAITASEMKPTRAGTGSFLQLTIEVLDGPHRGRLLWARLNLDNPNATAVKIAKSELSAVCRAVGVMSPRDSAELHNLPLTIKVRCRKRTDTGEITNEISGYAPRDTPPPAASDTNGSAPPPWKRATEVA